MGFSVKLAPGVRVRASSRGLRTSVGPRAARMHVGGGRTGFSTGVGPVGYYTSVSGRSRATGSRHTSTSSATRSLTAAAKAEQAQQLAAPLQQITDLHRQQFPAAQPPQAPTVAVPKLEELTRKHRKQQLAGIGLFQWGKRKEAKQRAFAAAQAEHEALSRTAQAETGRNTYGR